MMFWIAYGVVALVVYPRVVTLAAWGGQRRIFKDQKKPDGFDWVVFGGLFGLVIAAAWGLLLVWHIASKITPGWVTRAGAALVHWYGRPPRDVRRERARSENERMERDLGIQ